MILSFKNRKQEFLSKTQTKPIFLSYLRLVLGQELKLFGHSSIEEVNSILSYKKSPSQRCN